MITATTGAAVDYCTEAVVRAFLVPTAAGAWYAVASTDCDDRRNILLALLRGGTSINPSLDWFTRWTGLNDRRKVAALLFAMQRAGWLSGDTTPFPVRSGAAGMLLSALLKRVGGANAAVLADTAGLCVAFAASTREHAELLAARVASLEPRLRKIAAESDSWSLGSGNADITLSVRRLHLGRNRFLLVSGQDADLKGQPLVELVSVLARHCLGSTVCTHSVKGA